jgi:hypothetical protein
MTELAVRDPHALTARVHYAEKLAESGLLPPAYRARPANILYAEEYAALLGLPLMAAITGIHVIDGRPAMSAGLISALVRRAGHRVRVTGDDHQAQAEITRSDDPSWTYKSTWTIDRAKQAGLLGKTNWRQYPAAMLKARAVSEVARDACQEVLLGIQYTPDELGADDDGGEIVHDGWPVTDSGMVNGSEMSEDAKDAAGLMTRQQRVEHAQLRNMNQVNPADVEVADGTPDDDPWQSPLPEGKPKSPPAPQKWRDSLIKLVASVPLGKPEDTAAVLEWITGRPMPAGIDTTITRAEVKLIADIFKSHIEDAGGDTEQAASKLWEQYHAAKESSDD